MGRIALGQAVKGFLGAVAGRMKAMKKPMLFGALAGIVLGCGALVYFVMGAGGPGHGDGRAPAREAVAAGTDHASDADDDELDEETDHPAEKTAAGTKAAAAAPAEKAHEDEKASEMAAVHSAPAAPGFWRKLLHAGEERVEYVQSTVAEISRSTEENRRLRLENANLRRWAEALRFECTSQESEDSTRVKGLKLAEETGVRVGRALASIPYSLPAHLLPPQLYTLGVSYFKGSESEKAAVILTYLTGLEDNESYKTARNFLMTGVAWYRLDNYKLADSYFDRVLKFSPVDENLPYHAQARLWRALVSKQLSDERTSQAWLRDLVDYHPHSMEAGWINPREAEK